MSVVVYCECGAVMDEIGFDLLRCPRCKAQLSLPVNSVDASGDTHAGPATPAPLEVSGDAPAESEWRAKRTRQSVQALVENIVRAAKALGDKLTPDETKQILRATELGSAALQRGDLRACEDCLPELETSANLLSAVLRRE